MTMERKCFLLLIFVAVSTEIGLALLVPYDGGRASSTRRRLTRHANDDPVAQSNRGDAHHSRSSAFGLSSARESPRRTTGLLSSEEDNDDGPRFTDPSEDEGPVSNLASDLRAAAREGFGTRARNVAETMAAGDVVVPICGNLERRSALAQRGLYAGVEYVINEIEGGSVTLRPAYRLRPHLERSDWPVTLPVSDVPLWLSKTTYQAGTALGTAGLAASFLATAFIASTFLRLVVVPSESMEPSLVPGDVVLVTRSVLPPRVGDVVFFDPPAELDEAIANSKIGQIAKDENVQIASTKGKQFIKRVVGVPGERAGVRGSSPFVSSCKGNECIVRVDKTGEYQRPDVFAAPSWDRETQILERGEFFVAGDNGYRSVDSRVWGPLRRKYIFGTAQWIVSPSHFGPIPPGPFETQALSK